VDVVVHSAGTFSAGPVATAPDAELDEQYRTNVRAAFVLTQALLPQVTQARGQIVLINSSTGLTSRAGVAQYAATKHALRALADGLRDEVNAQGVRVLSVYVGRTATPMQEQVTAFEGKPYRPEQLLQPEDVAECVLNALKMSETAEITDVSIRPMRKT
jgi:NADP-dependent 3-hydroxy acid dehydrogenase YdfG